jgi:capsular exopolysaccharide synthesis family protein
VLLQVSALATVPNFAMADGSRVRCEIPAGAATAEESEDGSISPARIVYHRPASIASEAFRVMRTAILYSAPEEPPRVILVTSSRSGEGKTVTTLNLAVVLGLSGARVLLIDADLRKPGCHWVLGVENTMGLSSHLAGLAELQDVIRPLNGIANVSFISAGPTPPNPAELLGSERMRTALAWAREHYDFVLVDSPPAIPVTDPVVLARDADGVLFVVKGHDTPRELARAARDRLAAVNARFLGVVVNNVDFRSGEFGSYYIYSPYYYGENASPDGAEEKVDT